MSLCEVADPDPLVQQVVGEVLGHLLRQRRHEDALVLVDPQLDLVDQVVDLALGRLEHHLGVDEAGRADDLLDGRPAPADLASSYSPGVAER